MITVVTLSADELAKMKKRSSSDYWEIALFMGIVAVAFGAIFSQWIVGLFTAGFILLIFYIAKLSSKNPIAGDQKIIRTGVVTEASLQRLGYRVRHTTITVMLEEEPLPDGCPPIHHFMVYHSFGSIGYEQDEQLPYYYKKLKGVAVEIAYMAENGFVVGFRLDDNH